MLYSGSLFTQGFYGGGSIKGLPLYVKDGVRKVPGTIIDTTYTAYFGRVVSSDEATPNQFEMGMNADIFVGVLLNEAGVNQNEPAKNDYRLPLEPVTAIRYGAFFIKGWTTTASGALSTPTRSSTPIFSNTTGQIEFIASTSSVPSGWSRLPAQVWLVDTAVNGVLLFMDAGAESGELAGLPVLPFETDSSATVLRALNFEKLSLTGITNTDGTIFSSGSTWLVHGATAGMCAMKFLFLP